MQITQKAQQAEVNITASWKQNPPVENKYTV